MAGLGLTKARSLGPIAEAVGGAGGSIERTFRRADLPSRLLDRPEQLILLRDQMCLLEEAAREIGDPALPARLSTEAGVAALGDYATTVCAEPTLGAAIDCANATVDSLLQSSTRQSLVVSGGDASWTYELAEPSTVGRQKNELLALGYRLDLMRRFLGAAWTPRRVIVSGAYLQGRDACETALGCDVTAGPTMAVEFSAEVLDAPNCAPARSPDVRTAAGPIADGDRLLDLVEALILLELLDRLPRLETLCVRLGIPRRTLQRRLSEAGTSFAALRSDVLEREAMSLLSQPDKAITAVALELGYRDPAHFCRAFRKWRGEPPERWNARRR